MRKRYVTVSKRLRRMWAMALAVMMLASVLSGCGKQQAAGRDVAEEESETESADIAGKSDSDATATEKDENVIEYHINNEGYVITVDVNNDNYATASDPVDAPEKYNADMRADCIMSAFDPKRGETEFNHPNCIATDGTHFALCDTWNNRVLVWNSLPTGNVQADVVLGQKDYESFIPGYGMDQLNWPVGVTFAGDKLIVADTHNNRLLVWDSVPTVSGEAADHVITALSASDDMMWPWAVWSDGTRLIVTSTEVGQVGFWDNVDSAIAGEYATHVINTGGTPRTIVTDGDYLLIGDHNMGKSNDGSENGHPGSLIWRTYPTDGHNPDFTIDLQLDGAIIDGDVYALSQRDEKMYIYDGLIDSPDKESVLTFDNKGELFRNGDHGSILYADSRTYVCYYNSGFVAIYDGKITKDNYMSPMGLLGADENVKSMSVLRGQYQNTAPATDGSSLVFVDDLNGLIGIYKTFPDTFNAIPDYLYHFPAEWDCPIDVVVDKNGRLLVLTDSSVLIWNKIPLEGELYDKRIEFEHVLSHERSKIEACDEGFIVYSEPDKKIYKLPISDAASSFDNAIASVDAQNISGLTCDGKYLIAAKEEEKKVTIYNVSDLSVYGEVYSTSNVRNKEGFYPDFEAPKEAILLPNGQFLAGDLNMIRVWDSLDEAIADREFTKCTYMGMLDNYPIYTKYGGVIRDESHNMATDGSIFQPHYFAYSHGHLWVGEFKFSSRLLRYDIKYDSEAETKYAAGDAAEAEESDKGKGSAEYDLLVSQSIATHATMTLSADAHATIDEAILKDFSLDCAGHDITISGRIFLDGHQNHTFTIINPGKVDLSGLEFYKDPALSVDKDCDYLVVIKGENLDITPPANVPAGSRKEKTKGFYYEAKSSSVAIRYGGQ